MRYTHSYEHSVSLSRKDFDIVHDLILIDDDSAIVCGNITEQVDCSGTPALDSSSNIAFIAKVNLSDGSFAWYKSRIKNANASRLALNNTGTIIAMAVNFELSNTYPGISFWDRAGNYLFGNIFEADKYIGNLTVSDTVYNNATMSFHNNIIIQNIYFNSDGNLFISGKFFNIRVQGKNLLDHFDMPFNTIDDINASSGVPTIGNFNIYKSAEKFLSLSNSNILSYKYWNDIPCHKLFTQIYAASNTLPCLSGCETDEYVTVTLDEAIDANTSQVGLDKVWIFSNDNNPCGNINIDSDNLDLPIFPVSLVMYNDNILVTPSVDDFNYSNSNPSSYIHNCEQ